VLPEWLVGLVPGARSARASKRALPFLETAQALRDSKPFEALAAAREGLDVLRDPIIQRRGPVESTLLVSLTTLTEEVAQGLGQRGAALQDLRDAVSILRGLNGAVARFPDLADREPASVQQLRSTSLPYLEARLAAQDEPSRE